MKLNWFACFILGAALTLSSGCRSTVSGDNKLAVPFMKDTIESRYNRSIDKVQIATRETLAFNGTITSDDSVTRVIQAQINNRRVYVRLEEVEPQVTRVLVQVFKGAGSDIEIGRAHV